jgi:hypothetical protein
VYFLEVQSINFPTEEVNFYLTNMSDICSCWGGGWNCFRSRERDGWKTLAAHCQLLFTMEWLFETKVHKAHSLIQKISLSDA